jgi:non-specific serine/threonine protein kinase
MGSIYWQYANAGFKSEEECILKIKDCAEKIFALDPQSHLGHRLLGIIAYKRGDPRAVVRYMKRVLESNPDDLDAAIYLSAVYLNAGKISYAWPLVNRHVANDPFNVVSYIISGFVYWCDGDFPGALNQFQKGHHLDLENPMLRALNGVLLAANNREEEAITILSTLGDEHGALGHMGRFFKYCLQGDKANALQSISEQLTETAMKDEEMSWFMADGYALLDEKEEALSWLENAANRGFVNYPFLSEYDPFLKNLRGDERFDKLMARVKHEWENFEV